MRSRATAAASLALVALLAAPTGCSSAPHAKSRSTPAAVLSPANREIARGSVAAVEIRNQKPDTIRETLESVYTGAGFRVGSRKPEALCFDRPATRYQVAAYGSWFGMEVWTRLKVEIIPQSSGQFLLVCRSYVVREAGTISEDQQPLARRHVREYEPLLDEVASRLN